MAKESKEPTKKLTQMQKDYLVKRINGIANTKIKKLGGLPNYGEPVYQYTHTSKVCECFYKHRIDTDVIQAIIDGKIKIKSRPNMVSSLKEAIANSQTNLNYLVFIDLPSLEKFNADRNSKALIDFDDREKRTALVKSEADSLKDSVVLDSSMATKVLEDFEKQMF